MKKNNKNGFTLVELLAVIVILAIILVIAVPKVMSTIKDTTKASLESSAKMVAAQVEKQYTVAQTLGKEFGDTGSCMQEWAGLNDVDYASCTYEITSNGTAKITIKGQGKFKNLYVCSGTRSGATATEGECASNTLVSHIQELYSNESTKTSNGLTKDNTIDQNIRYAGANNAVKNYVEFGNIGELWRIIGIFEVEKASGGTEELVKIVREDSIGHIAWDVSDENINYGYGINQWGQSGEYLGADLMQLLNGKYLNKQNAENTCFDWDTEEMGTCNFSSTGMNSTYKSMIETVIWNTGAWDGVDTTIADFNNMNLNTVNLYNAERGTLGKTCTEEDSGSACSDEVERSATWEGLVALPYPTDYGYASSETGCNTNMWTGLDGNAGTTACKNNNWMHYGTSSQNMSEVTWFLSPFAFPGGAFGVSIVYGGGMAYSIYANDPLRVRPTLYLKSNIQIIDGDGSEGNAYKLSA